MTRKIAVLATVLAAALQAAPARAVVPQVMSYSGYLKTSAGAPVTTATNLSFRLYTASSGGVALWTETLSVTPSADGWFSVVLGVSSPLPFASLNDELYLGIEVGSEGEFATRARLTPSYAAITVDWARVSNRPGTCAAGQFLTGFDASGTATCSTPPTGGGGISSVTGAAGGFITATTTSGAVSLSVAGCGASPNQILQWSGTNWACIPTPTPVGGGVSSVQVQQPLINTGTATAPNLGLTNTCGPDQVLKWTAGSNTWRCANDNDTTNVGTVTSVGPAATAGNPITVANGASTPTIDIPPASAGVSGYLRGTDYTAFSAKITAPGGCTDGQVLKWNALSGAFVCAADNSNAGTVTDVSAIGPLLSSGGARPVISMPAATPALDGYLSATDWRTFSDKIGAVDGTAPVSASSLGGRATVSLSGCGLAGKQLMWNGTSWVCSTITFPLQVGGTSAAPTLALPQASNSADGFLVAGDWIRFDAKVSGIAPGDGITVDNITDPRNPLVSVSVGPGLTVATGRVEPLFTGIGGNFGSSTDLARADHSHPVRVSVPAVQLLTDAVSVSSARIALNPFVNVPAYVVSPGGAGLPVVYGVVTVPKAGAGVTLRFTIRNPAASSVTFSLGPTYTPIVAGALPPSDRYTGANTPVVVGPQQTGVVSFFLGNPVVPNAGCAPGCPSAGVGDLFYFGLVSSSSNPAFEVLGAELVF